MKKFEYKVIDCPRTGTPESLLPFLKHTGQEGWEVCATNYGRFILKREIQDESLSLQKPFPTKRHFFVGLHKGRVVEASADAHLSAHLDEIVEVKEV